MNPKTKTKLQGAALAAYLDNCNRLTETFYMIVNMSRKHGFTSDNVYNAAVKAKIPLTVIKSRLPGLFLTFKRNGIIRKLPTFRLSERNDSKPLPVWISTITPEQAESDEKFRTERAERKKSPALPNQTKHAQLFR